MQGPGIALGLFLARNNVRGKKKIAAMASQPVLVRGKAYFVCEYTGALVQQMYFVPFGKDLKQKERCFATLPILLRAILEEEGGEYTDRFQKIKHDCEVFFVQPDIPVHPPLPVERTPLSPNEFLEYAEELELGLSWTLVEKAVPAEKKRKPKKLKVAN